MNTTTSFEKITAFEAEVIEGLTSLPRRLPSKYFYDETGDQLFQQIMDLPEYYLTKAEHSIFEKQKKNIIDALDPFKTGFDLIELGAGDGLKTKTLLKELLVQEHDFRYMPIDISQNAIDGLTNNLRDEMPGLEVNGQQGEYFEVLEKLKTYNDRKKVILFLGSNIGNLSHDLAIEFLTRLKGALNPQDVVLMGFDLKKNPDVILNAYNDSQGITASFNRNLLTRINREMQANFDESKFMHKPYYDPETGTAKSFLVSIEEQSVYFRKLDISIHFKAWESIHTEISQKYDHRIIEWLCKQSGLAVESFFTDDKKWYANYLLSSGM